MNLPTHAVGAFMDAAYCLLQDIREALLRLAPEEPAREEVVASTPNRQGFNAEGGRLASTNPRRSGFYVHNATDGTLLILFGEGKATPRRYTLAIGPGDWFASDRVSEETIKGPMQYAWVTAESELSGFPEGTFLPATAGQLMFTEESVRVSAA